MQYCWAVLQAAQSALHGPAGSCMKLDETSVFVAVNVTVSFASPALFVPIELKYSTTIWWGPASTVVVALTATFPW